MTKSPRLTNQPSRTTKSQKSISAPMLLFMTALDTTWRTFVPTIGGTFLGVWLDHVFGIAPIATIVCIIAGFATSALLITLQIRRVRKLITK